MAFNNKSMIVVFQFMVFILAVAANVGVAQVTPGQNNDPNKPSASVSWHYVKHDSDCTTDDEIEMRTYSRIKNLETELWIKARVSVEMQRQVPTANPNVFEFVPYPIPADNFVTPGDAPADGSAQAMFFGLEKLIDVAENEGFGLTSPKFKLPPGRYRVCARAYARFNVNQSTSPGPAISGDELYREIDKEFGSAFDVDPPAGGGDGGEIDN